MVYGLGIPGLKIEGFTWRIELQGLFWRIPAWSCSTEIFQKNISACARRLDKSKTLSDKNQRLTWSPHPATTQELESLMGMPVVM